MAFYNHSVRGERTPHSLQQPRRDVTRDVVCIQHAAALAYKNAGVRPPDTDIFVIVLYHVHAINLSTYLDT